MYDMEAYDDPEVKKVREWRHKLQSRFHVPSALKDIKIEDMPDMALLFTTLEEYEDMTGVLMRLSKIDKVLNHIALLPAEKIPREDEFNFRQRARDLVIKWRSAVASNAQAQTQTQTQNVNQSTEGNPTVVG